MARELLMIGSTCVDVIIPLERLPQTGDDLQPAYQTFAIGGTGWNACRAAILSGVTPTFLSPVGTGMYARMVEDAFADYGVRVMARSEQENGCCYCLVEADGEPMGCIAMQKLDESRCEMKRLYIRPAYRGHGIARHLVERLLDDARQDGYEAMVLDTFPFLGHALHLYRDMGFYEISSYNNSPLDSTIYMRKDLCPA